MPLPPPAPTPPYPTPHIQVFPTYQEPGTIASRKKKYPEGKGREHGESGTGHWRGGGGRRRGHIEKGLLLAVYTWQFTLLALYTLNCRDLWSKTL